MYEFHTPDTGNSQQYVYNIITSKKEVISFKLKACNDGHVALQTVPGSSDDPMYEIVFGGYSNTRSEIREAKGVRYSLYIS